MAGHSQFKNIMYRKGAQDKKRSMLFAKLAREVTVAAKSGLPDPNANARLRVAVDNARAQNMPKDNIDRAIKKAMGGEGENYESVRYEGFGPGGVSLIVDSLTDNRNRTAGEVRSAFSKSGGNMGEVGSVSYQFDHVGEILFPLAVANSDAMFEAALEAGANDVVSDEESHVIYCSMEDLNLVREALVGKFGQATSVKIIWKPQTLITVDEDQAKSLMKLLDALDDSDDVQNVFGNYDVPDDILAKLG
ncbi:YebC/PmpR family DNA-binding transcriptional regulator [Govanella unica]|uniref:Probable transcriptional regulatory protein NYP16_13185 n=1 Tax=Govanella unica TaxID=2975056 RepID=A0A9X3U000_9PROT|nr:YebC/PmpR family DNA-binding transcriptional regulator [Govania unica]MDA5194906.1 YebC/PmpR family DNA-binding transcriptional regulator [Govania unica]